MIQRRLYLERVLQEGSYWKYSVPLEPWVNYERLTRNPNDAPVPMKGMDQGKLTIYRGCTPIVDAQYGPESDRSPSEVVIAALAEAAGVDPLELPPLYEFVDGDALDNLFEEQNRVENTDTLLSFRVENWNVFVRADGRVRVCDGTQTTDPEPVFESTPS